MIFSISFAAASMLAGFVIHSGVLVIACAFLYVSGSVFAILKGKSRFLRLLECIMLGAASAFLVFSLYNKYIISPCRIYDGQTENVILRVTDYPQSGDGYTRIEGKIGNEKLPNRKIIVYDNKEHSDLLSFVPGDFISFNAKLKSSDIRYGEKYYYYYSSGLFLIANIRSEIDYIGHDDGFLSSLRYFAVNVSHYVSEAVNALYSMPDAAFLKSLLVNDRFDFNSDSRLSVTMSRAGIMHIVAVSGMHVAFLVGFIRLVFGNRRRTSVISLVLIWFFVVMTGASPSAMRAGLMQSLLVAAPLFRRESDMPTSLSFALLVLLVINPWAIRSVSLQLSFSATAGIILFAGPIYNSIIPKGKENKKGIMSYIAGVVSCSIGVMIFTIPICAYHFGCVQILSVLTNVLVIWAVSLCFGGGYLSVILFRIFPSAGKIIAAPVSWIAKYITSCADKISSFTFSTLYFSNADNSGLYLIIALYCVLLVFLILRLPRKIRIIVPAALSVILISIFLSFTKLYYQSFPAVYSVIDVGQGQCIAVFSGDRTVVIDCGSIMTAENAGDIAGKYLLSCGRDKVDLLVLTHLHEDHVNGAVKLSEYVKVREIAMLSQSGNGEHYDEIIRNAGLNGTACTEIDNTFEKCFGAAEITLYRPKPSGNDLNEECLFVNVSADDYDMFITADASKETEMNFISENSIPETDILVIGHHGSKNSASDELLERCRHASGVISTGYNTYGHPAEETLDRAHKYLDRVYRTDHDGTLQFFIGKSRLGDTMTWLRNSLKAVIFRQN